MVEISTEDMASVNGHLPPDFTNLEYLQDWLPFHLAFDQKLELLLLYNINQHQSGQTCS